MAGTIKIAVPANLNAKDLEEERLAAAIVAEVRAKTKTPKRMNVHGAYGSWICVPFVTNVVRDVIISVVEARGLEYEIR